MDRGGPKSTLLPSIPLKEFGNLPLKYGPLTARRDKHNIEKHSDNTNKIINPLTHIDPTDSNFLSAAVKAELMVQKMQHVHKKIEGVHPALLYAAFHALRAAMDASYPTIRSVISSIIPILQLSCYASPSTDAIEGFCQICHCRQIKFLPAMLLTQNDSKLPFLCASCTASVKDVLPVENSPSDPLSNYDSIFNTHQSPDLLNLLTKNGKSDAFQTSPRAGLWPVSQSCLTNKDTLKTDKNAKHEIEEIKKNPSIPWFTLVEHQKSVIESLSDEISILSAKSRSSRSIKETAMRICIKMQKDHRNSILSWALNAWRQEAEERDLLRDTVTRLTWTKKQRLMPIFTSWRFSILKQKLSKLTISAEESMSETLSLQEVLAVQQSQLSDLDLALREERARCEVILKNLDRSESEIESIRLRDTIEKPNLLKKSAVRGLGMLQEVLNCSSGIRDTAQINSLLSQDFRLLYTVTERQQLRSLSGVPVEDVISHWASYHLSNARREASTQMFKDSSAAGVSTETGRRWLIKAQRVEGSFVLCTEASRERRAPSNISDSRSLILLFTRLVSIKFAELGSLRLFCLAGLDYDDGVARAKFAIKILKELVLNDSQSCILTANDILENNIRLVILQLGIIILQMPWLPKTDNFEGVTEKGGKNNESQTKRRIPSHRYLGNGKDLLSFVRSEELKYMNLMNEHQKKLGKNIERQSFVKDNENNLISYTSKEDVDSSLTSVYKHELLYDATITTYKALAIISSALGSCSPLGIHFVSASSVHLDDLMSSTFRYSPALQDIRLLLKSSEVFSDLAHLPVNVVLLRWLNLIVGPVLHVNISSFSDTSLKDCSAISLLTAAVLPEIVDPVVLLGDNPVYAPTNSPFQTPKVMHASLINSNTTDQNKHIDNSLVIQHRAYGVKQAIERLKFGQAIKVNPESLIAGHVPTIVYVIAVLFLANPCLGPATLKTILDVRNTTNSPSIEISSPLQLDHGTENKTAQVDRELLQFSSYNVSFLKPKSEVLGNSEARLSDGIQNSLAHSFFNIFSHLDVWTVASHLSGILDAVDLPPNQKSSTKIRTEDTKIANDFLLHRSALTQEETSKIEMDLENKNISLIKVESSNIDPNKAEPESDPFADYEKSKAIEMVMAALEDFDENRLTFSKSWNSVALSLARLNLIKSRVEDYLLKIVSSLSSSVILSKPISFSSLGKFERRSDFLDDTSRLVNDDDDDSMLNRRHYDSSKPNHNNWESYCDFNISQISALMKMYGIFASSSGKRKNFDTGNSHQPMERNPSSSIRKDSHLSHSRIPTSGDDIKGAAANTTSANTFEIVEFTSTVSSQMKRFASFISKIYSTYSSLNLYPHVKSKNCNNKGLEAIERGFICQLPPSILETFDEQPGLSWSSLVIFLIDFGFFESREEFSIWHAETLLLECILDFNFRGKPLALNEKIFRPFFASNTNFVISRSVFTLFLLKLAFHHPITASISKGSYTRETSDLNTKFESFSPYETTESGFSGLNKAEEDVVNEGTIVCERLSQMFQWMSNPLVTSNGGFKDDEFGSSTITLWSVLRDDLEIKKKLEEFSGIVDLLFDFLAERQMSNNLKDKEKPVEVDLEKRPRKGITVQHNNTENASTDEPENESIRTVNPDSSIILMLRSEQLKSILKGCSLTAINDFQRSLKFKSQENRLKLSGSDSLATVRHNSELILENDIHDSVFWNCIRVLTGFSDVSNSENWVVTRVEFDVLLLALSQAYFSHKPFVTNLQKLHLFLRKIICENLRLVWEDLNFFGTLNSHEEETSLALFIAEALKITTN